MDSEKCTSVAISEFHGGIHRDHVSGYSSGIGASLNSEMVEFYALDGDFGLHGSASTPEDEREEREENEEAKQKGEDIATARERTFAIFGLEKTLFFDYVDVLPRFLVAVAMVVVDFARTRETTRRRVRVRRGTHWAENRG